MKNMKKKVVYSLLAGTILSLSTANAANYDFNNLNCDTDSYNYKNGYTVNYNYNNKYNNNSNIQQNTVLDKYPTFNWSVVVTKPTTKPGNVVELPKPSTPSTPSAPSTPSTPSKPDYSKPNNQEPSNPTTPTPPATETPSTSGLSAMESEVVRLVNIERQKEGLQPFTTSSELSKVARVKSEDMATKNYFSHTSPTYGSPFEMMKSFGVKYNTAGENIARGQLTAQSVVNGWMNSSGHRANIMNPSFNKIGVGLAKSSNGTNYWTQMFTN